MEKKFFNARELDLLSKKERLAKAQERLKRISEEGEKSRAQKTAEEPIGTRTGNVIRFRGARKEKPQEEFIDRGVYEASGVEFEKELLGSISVANPKYQKEYQELFLDYLSAKGLAENEARQLMADESEDLLDPGIERAWMLVKRSQQGDPVNPQSPFGKILRQEIIDILNVPEKSQKRIKFYTAVSRDRKSLAQCHGNKKEMRRTLTSLDAYYNTDAFLEIGGDNTGDSIDGLGYIEAFDATINREKRTNPKVIEIFNMRIPSFDEDQTSFRKVIRKIAKTVVADLPQHIRHSLSPDYQETAKRVGNLSAS